MLSSRGQRQIYVHVFSSAARFAPSSVAQVSSQQFATQLGGFSNSVRLSREKDYYLRHVRPSVRPYITARPSPDGSPSNLILETFAKICRANPNFVTIGQKYRAGTLHDDFSTFHCCRPHTIILGTLHDDFSTFHCCRPHTIAITAVQQCNRYTLFYPVTLT